MAEPRPVTMPEAMTMRRLYVEERMSLAEVGRELDRSLSTVRRTLLGLGVQLRRPYRNTRPHPNRTPHAVVRESIEVYREENNVARAARRLGVPAATLRHRLKQAGEPISQKKQVTYGPIHNKLSPEKEQEVVDLYRSGLNQREVCEVAGIARGTFARVMKRNGVEHRTRGEGVSRGWESKRLAQVGQDG